MQRPAVERKAEKQFPARKPASELGRTYLFAPSIELQISIIRSQYPKIDFADQLGSVCLGGFHVGRNLLRRTRVRPENDGASDNSCNRANHERGIESDRPEGYCQD
jgi:hypothetical protein